jgi:hypothetical protein
VADLVTAQEAKPRIRVADPTGKVVFEESGTPEDLLGRLDGLLH